eukprot:12936899-Prorocentrum_lima.AAC.1
MADPAPAPASSSSGHDVVAYVGVAAPVNADTLPKVLIGCSAVAAATGVRRCGVATAPCNRLRAVAWPQ